jgi:hypothetical protein
MKTQKSVEAIRAGMAMALAAALLLAPVRMRAESEPEPDKEKRYLVRYDHGTSNLGPWQELALYVGEQGIQVYAGNELIHQIAARNLTSVTHELRAPFDPAKTTERVFNNTLGACSDLLTCPVLGAAGVVGAAGVGIATLFTPKEIIVTLNWDEANEARTLAMKVAWYQRDFILRAIEKSTGVQASERKPGRPQPAQKVAPRPADAQGTQQVAAGAATPAPGTAGQMQSLRLYLERDVMLGSVVLRRGDYDVYWQERESGIVVAFALAGEPGPAVRLLARVVAASEAAAEGQAVGVVYADGQSITSIREIRMPGRTLRLPV